ncbi:MAG TPA: glycosyl hydrolase, partial [Draconibacterium sp.]|nr:glycosyl hydrolase [Draconibacterium sp.]
FGQNGHKLISSAADYYDRPVVSTEIYGAFKDIDYKFDSLMLYRPMFEMFTRGVNFVIPHGMWYNPELVYISPLVSPYNKEIAPALPAYSDFVGRSCLLLQGGRRISEIGVMYPFEELAGHFVFDNPDGIRQGFYISPETDYQEISGILSNDIRRDFTFIHPEFFLEDKYQIENGTVKLNNIENFQEYKVMFLTGCKTVSWKALQKLKAFYESGGTIISTTQLPFKSSEMGEDQKVVDLVNEIFGLNPIQTDSANIQTNSNSKGGYAVFIPQPNKSNIQKVLDERIEADVAFEPNPVLKSDFGKFNYIHKIKDGKNIYMFTNSSDEKIETEVLLRGKLKMEVCDPHSGNTSVLKRLPVEGKDGQLFTKCKLELNPVSSVFWIDE